MPVPFHSDPKLDISKYSYLVGLLRGQAVTKGLLFHRKPIGSNRPQGPASGRCEMTNMEKFTTKEFSVAGHRFSVSAPLIEGGESVFRAYEAFGIHDCRPEKQLFTLSVEISDTMNFYGKPLRRINNEAPYSWIYAGNAPLVIGFSISKDRPNVILRVAPDFSSGCVELPPNAGPVLMEFAINNSSMLMYMLATANSDTLLIHASSVICNGKAFAFTGHSGSGKSTHSRLWLKNIPACELLNDDNPIVRIIDGQAIIYGSPWSGGTACWKNMEAPLKAIVHISQAPENRIEQLKGVRAYASFIASCSNLKWNRRVADGIHACVEKLLGLCPVYELSCLPDPEAALLCHSSIK